MTKTWKNYNTLAVKLPQVSSMLISTWQGIQCQEREVGLTQIDYKNIKTNLFSKLKGPSLNPKIVCGSPLIPPLWTGEMTSCLSFSSTCRKSDHFTNFYFFSVYFSLEWIIPEYMITHELWLELSLQAWLNTCCQVDLLRLSNSSNVYIYREGKISNSGLLTI